MVKPEQLNLLENRREIRHFVHKKADVTGWSHYHFLRFTNVSSGLAGILNPL